MVVHKLVIQTTVLIQADDIDKAKEGMRRELPDLSNALDGIIEENGLGFSDTFEIVSVEALTEEALQNEMTSRDREIDFFD